MPRFTLIVLPASAWVKETSGQCFVQGGGGGGGGGGQIGVAPPLARQGGGQRADADAWHGGGQAIAPACGQGGQTTPGRAPCEAELDMTHGGGQGCGWASGHTITLWDVAGRAVP